MNYIDFFDEVETMHWLPDIHYGEDYCRIENRTVQQSLNLLRKFAISLLKQCKAGSPFSRVMSKLMPDCILEPDRLSSILEN